VSFAHAVALDVKAVATTTSPHTSASPRRSGSTARGGTGCCRRSNAALVRPEAPGAVGRRWWPNLFLVAKRLGEVFCSKASSSSRTSRMESLRRPADRDSVHVPDCTDNRFGAVIVPLSNTPGAAAGEIKDSGAQPVRNVSTG
jgi:hypothetical protein